MKAELCLNLCKWQGFSVKFIWTNYLMSIGTCFEFGIAWYARFVWIWKTRFYIFLKSFKIRINANWNLFSLTLKAPFTPSTGNIVLTGWWCKQNCLWLLNTFWEKKNPDDREKYNETNFNKIHENWFSANPFLQNHQNWNNVHWKNWSFSS